MKVFAFRFDIDTAKCLGQGVAPLIDLAERLGVQFTFFLNVGRSVSIPNFLLSRARGSKPGVDATQTAASLSARHKLGNLGYLYTAFFNPQIGSAYPKIVERLAKSQELGLHGGRNHELWHYRVQSWTKEKTTAEIEWAQIWLAKHGVEVNGFSAPGWSDRPDLAGILQDLGFRYRADRHGPGETWGQREGDLINVGTNLTGEPGGVAYLEHQRALGRNDQEVLEDFARRLDGAPDYAVMYDHPYFAGLHEIDLLEKMVKIVRNRGYAVRPLKDVAEYCRTKALK